MNPSFEGVQSQLLVFAREMKELYRQERRRSLELERAMECLNDAYLSTMKTLAFLVEAKDLGTRLHLDRTSQYGLALARLIDPGMAERPDLRYGFLLHDIGKIGISERILGKPGPLTDSEWSVMKTHPVIGAQVVSPMSFLGRASDVIHSHHERWDGNGYPRGLSTDRIPLAARVFTVVDAFDAMTSDRPYRKAMPVERAMEEVAANSGTQFDPDVVEAFLILMDGSRVSVETPAPSLAAG